MLFFLIIVTLFLFSIGLVLLLYLLRQKPSFGVLNEKRLYVDTRTKPGKVSFSKSTNLIGKPDYIIKKDGFYIPVEIKSGKTPSAPYLNHTTQLIAYFFLVEESYGIRPPGGYLKYPKKEFKIAYTQEARESIVKLSDEITNLQISGVQPKCTHCNL